jgi:hypothetical protein
MNEIEKKDLEKWAGSASLRDGKALGLSLYEIEEFIGISHITLSQSGVDSHSKAGGRANSLRFIHRRLRSKLRGDDAAIRAWLKKPHPNFNGQRPLDVILGHSGGLKHVSTYIWYHGTMAASMGEDIGLDV